MNINIGTPCSENWKTMLPNTTGKHCEKCNKSVIDLRHKSTSEIRELVHQHQRSSMCVRAYSFQLDDYQYVQPLKRLAFALLIVFGSTLFSLSAKAQKATQKMKETYLTNKQQASESKLKGIVSDETGEPLPFANVILIHNDTIIKGTTTDFDGKYHFDLDESYYNKKYTIRVSYIGYAHLELKDLILKKGVMIQDFTLNNYQELMGDIMIIPHDPPLINKDPASLNKTTFKRQEIQRSASGRP
ncbi:MAG: carboxypeptidase-like regulatory domain-containing protein [Flavobacteriales bacterium]|jgi:hypothetical protein|nr:carboxypeptidase-like regulatory domain-containing protein [Flavobacteriales bacterium]